jgi:predicted DsbA family dithiol-disulfide isomerase
LSYAETTGGISAQNQLSELLFRAYFTDGIFLSEENVCKLAGSIEGLTFTGAKEALANRHLVEDVRKEAAYFSQSGISGVPFFFINQQPAFSGARAPESILFALKTAMEQTTASDGQKGNT